jgi:hypothetical protein
MAHDHNDIYTIVERLRILEEGLDKNQKSVNQLSATFKPKTVAVLTSPKDPKNPMAGKLVGGCEESEEKEEPVLEAEMSEDILEKVKNSFKDFIKQAEKEIKDSDLKDKKKDDTDIKKKDKKDRDLIVKVAPVAEDSIESDEEWYDANGRPSEHGCYDAGGRYHPDREPDMDAGYDAYKERDWTEESAPVRTITNECGLWEVHGNERDGFEIRRGVGCLPTRFKNLDEAEMAIQMFAHRRRKADESQDYMEER